MKIGLAGVGGTGKGQLAKAFCKGLTGIEYVPSVVEHVGRTIMDNDHYNEVELWQKPMYQLAILTAQAEAERVVDSLNISYITAQSLLDFEPYYCSMLDEFEAGTISEKDLKETRNRYIGLIKKYLKESPYDAVFYVPLDPDAEVSDKWKQLDAVSRQKMDEQLKDFVQEICLSMDIKVVTLKGSEQDRVEQMVQTMKEEGFIID